ncbi:uncharacterized protein LOC144452896 isoform X2 [Glandiceps talaboti]
MSQLIEAIFYTTLAVMSLSHCCHGDCSYSIKEDMIVDFRPGTTPSTSPTPSTLNEISKSDLEECSELCCNNDNCTVAVFEEEKSTCHLIQCESENCPIVENSGFTTVEVTRNSTAEDESDDEGEEEGTVGSESDQGEEEGMVGSESEQDDEQGDKENESDNGEEGSETTKQTTVTQPTPTQTTGDTDENADKGSTESESTPANDEGQTSTPEDNSPQTDLQSTTVSTQMKTESSIEGKSTVASVPNDGTETEMSPGTTEMGGVTNGAHNETQLGHRIYDHTSTGALVAAMCFGILFLFAVLVLLGKRVYEGYQRRHYSKMDYLINGMYN